MNCDFGTSYAIHPTTTTFTQIILKIKAGFQMNNISLKKLTLMVVIAAVTSNFAYANDAAVIEKSKAISASKFTQLLNKFDQDKNGLLSAKEVKSEVKLHHAFKDIDTNKDANINETELNAFLKKVQSKEIVISKVNTDI